MPVDDALTAAEPVVQAMAPPGVALVIGSREDAAFGPMISLGLEGIPSELLGDTVYRVPPLTTVDAAAMVRDLRAAPVLFGRHGAPGVDTERIEDLLHRVAQLADDHPQLASVTLGPCLASARTGITVLSARVERRADPRPARPPGPRSLAELGIALVAGDIVLTRRRRGRMSGMRLGSTRRDLRSEIDACGYFPELVEDAIMIALADEDLLDFVVHHEPTFNRDEIHRHVTVLALTPTRLLIGHTDDQPAEPPAEGIYAASSTESVALSKIDTVALTRVVTQPEHYRTGSADVYETWLSVGWGAVRRVDLEPATCTDPQCEADHGFTGTLVGDDLTVRMSAAADGSDRVARLVRFATNLQRVTVG